MIDHPDVVLLATGHADARGAVGYNFDLSLRRARAAQRHLIALGVSPTQVIAHAMPEAEASSLEEQTANQQADRRVQLELFRQ